MVDLSVDNVFAANNAMELRAYYQDLVDKFDLLAADPLTELNVTIEFTDKELTYLDWELGGGRDYEDTFYLDTARYPVQFGIVQANQAFSAIRADIEAYLRAKVVEQEIILTNLGVTY